MLFLICALLRLKCIFPENRKKTTTRKFPNFNLLILRNANDPIIKRKEKKTKKKKNNERSILRAYSVSTYAKHLI